MGSLKTRAVLVGGLSMVRSFAGLDIPTVVISRNAGGVAKYSRYCNDWRTTFLDSNWDEPYFLEVLFGIAAERPDTPVLYYGDDLMLAFVSEHRNTLRSYYRFSMPGPEVVAACNDKIMFTQLAQQQGLPVPISIIAGANLDSDTIAKHIHFPCVFKPALRTGWYKSPVVQQTSRGIQKVLVANNAAECDAALDTMRQFSERFIVQEFIPGHEDQIYSFHTYIPENGNPPLWYLGKKIRTFPAVGGESSYIELVNNPELAALGFQIVGKLDLKGPIKIDFKRDPRSNKFLVLEINLRFNLWNQLGTHCGVNLPLAAYLDHTGSPQPETAPYRTGIGWLQFGLDLRGFIREYYPTRQLSLGAWIASLRRPKVCSMFCWRDPLPFIMFSMGFLRRLPRKLLENTR